MVAVTERYRSKSESPGRMDEPKQPSSQVSRSRSLQVSVGIEGEGGLFCDAVLNILYLQAILCVKQGPFTVAKDLVAHTENVCRPYVI